MTVYVPITHTLAENISSFLASFAFWGGGGAVLLLGAIFLHEWYTKGDVRPLLWEFLTISAPVFAVMLYLAAGLAVFKVFAHMVDLLGLMLGIDFFTAARLALPALMAAIAIYFVLAPAAIRALSRFIKRRLVSRRAPI